VYATHFFSISLEDLSWFRLEDAQAGTALDEWLFLGFALRIEERTRKESIYVVGINLEHLHVHSTEVAIPLCPIICMTSTA
jgi:hypothetical protein